MKDRMSGSRPRLPAFCSLSLSLSCQHPGPDVVRIHLSSSTPQRERIPFNPALGQRNVFVLRRRRRRMPMHWGRPHLRSALFLNVFPSSSPSPVGVCHLLLFLSLLLLLSPFWWNVGNVQTIWDPRERERRLVGVLFGELRNHKGSP